MINYSSQTAAIYSAAPDAPAGQTSRYEVHQPSPSDTLSPAGTWSQIRSIVGRFTEVSRTRPAIFTPACTSPAMPHGKTCSIIMPQVSQDRCKPAAATDRSIPRPEFEICETGCAHIIPTDCNIVTTNVTVEFKVARYLPGRQLKLVRAGRLYRMLGGARSRGREFVIYVAS